MTGTEITNAAGPALESNGIQVEGNFLLRDRLLLTGHDEFGAADLAGARIGNALQFASTRP